jgi:hypothetical protein
MAGMEVPVEGEQAMGYEEGPESYEADDMIPMEGEQSLEVNDASI